MNSSFLQISIILLAGVVGFIFISTSVVALSQEYGPPAPVDPEKPVDCAAMYAPACGGTCTFLKVVGHHTAYGGGTEWQEPIFVPTSGTCELNGASCKCMENFNYDRIVL